MTDKLAEICATKRDEVAARKVLASIGELDARAAAQTAPRGFEAALRATAARGFALIVAGQVDDWFEGVEEAAEAIDRGLANGLLDCWIETVK